MKKLYIIALLIGIVVGSTATKGQQTNTFVNGIIQVGTSTSGACRPGGIYIHRTTGAIYYCPSATLVWTALSGGGGTSDTFCVDAANFDTCLGRGSAAGQLTLSSTTNSTTNTFRVKNGANAELGAIGWTGNNFVVGTQGGTSGGTARDTILGSAAGATNGIYLATEDTSRFNLNPSGHLVPFVNNTYDIGDATHLIRHLYAGLITGATYNGLGVTTTTGTFTLANGKTFVVNNGLTLAGTDSTTMTFPATSATIARTDAANTFTGTQTIGALVATSLNGNTFTTGTYTLTGANGKTLTFNNSLALAGTDSTTMTFPSTSATIARTDAAQTFTGDQSFSNILVSAFSDVTTGNATTTAHGLMPKLNASSYNSFVGGGSFGHSFARGTITTSDPFVWSQTWNAGGVTFLGAVFNMTDTASAAASRIVDFQLAGSSVASIGKGGDVNFRHLVGGGTAPTVANTSANSCGTTAATIAGTDTAGKITVGATSGTSCTITFGTAYANAPSCWATDESTLMGVKAISTTTTVIISATAFTAGDVIAYGCVGY